MFWVIQMLSLTEFAAGSSVSTFTAFAITSVSLLAVLPPAPVDPPLPPQPAASTTVAMAATTAARRARHAGLGLVVGVCGRSAMADPFIRAAKCMLVPERCTKCTEKILMLLGCNGLPVRSHTNHPSRDAAECMRGGSEVSRVRSAV